MIIEKWFRMGNFGLDEEDGRVGRGVLMRGFLRGRVVCEVFLVMAEVGDDLE